MKTPLTPTLLVGIVALIAAGCGPQSLAESVPLVEPRPIAVDEELLESAPYREGLSQEVLPLELDGRRLDAEHVVRATTSCGLRTVWGRYGEAIVMLWRAPTREDAESGVLGVAMETDPPADRIGPRKAAITIGQLHDGTAPAGRFYPARQVIASEQDAEGVVWFATEGENLKYWSEPMHEKQTRYSFWWRSGLWIVGVDAPEADVLEPIAAELQHWLTADGP